jgi:hypothetical protein
LYFELQGRRAIRQGRHRQRAKLPSIQSVTNPHASASNFLSKLTAGSDRKTGCRITPCRNRQSTERPPPAPAIDGSSAAPSRPAAPSRTQSQRLRQWSHAAMLATIARPGSNRACPMEPAAFPDSPVSNLRLAAGCPLPGGFMSKTYLVIRNAARLSGSGPQHARPGRCQRTTR